jgi:hypothetical protein
MFRRAEMKRNLEATAEAEEEKNGEKRLEQWQRFELRRTS